MDRREPRRPGELPEHARRGAEPPDRARGQGAPLDDGLDRPGVLGGRGRPDRRRGRRLPPAGPPRARRLPPAGAPGPRARARRTGSATASTAATTAATPGLAPAAPATAA